MTEQAVIFFVDIRGFTRLAENAEFTPYASDFVSDFEKCLAEQFPELSCQKMLGDGAMLVTRYDGSSKAISSIEVWLKSIATANAAFGQITQKYSREAGVPIDAGLGWGGTRGRVSAIADGKDFIGTAVNRAARLCDCARPSGVILDRSSFPEMPSKEVDGAWNESSRQLNGIDRPVLTWETDTPYADFQTRERRRESPEVHVAGVCIRPDGRILIAKRKPSRDLHPGLWEGCGGQLRRGETFASGVIRHYRSELGVSVKPDPACYLIYAAHSEGRPIIPGVRYLCDWLEGEPLAKNHTDFRWVSLQELEVMPSDDFPPDFQREVNELLAMRGKA